VHPPGSAIVVGYYNARSEQCKNRYGLTAARCVRKSVQAEMGIRRILGYEGAHEDCSIGRLVLLGHKVWQEVFVAGWVFKEPKDLVECRKPGCVLRLRENVLKYFASSGSIGFWFP
jgi:hypothetical protein